MKTKINAWKINPGCASGDTIEAYLFQNQTVYVFSHGNCIADAGSAVYNENCAMIGSLGGLTGNRLVNGVDFVSNTTLIKVIWSN